jgi:myo-inositol-1(or 4)-monophosphatase
MEHQIKPREVLSFLSHLSRSAGKVLLDHFNGDFRIDRKNPFEGSIDIVTDADRASEALILEEIHREFPDHDILTEETPTTRSGSPWLWVVDPLDGTVNFAHGFPVFCTSIALVEHGRLLAGMVYDPLRKDSFFAARDSGASLNGEPIHVSKANRIDRSLLATGFPYDQAISPDNNLAEFCAVAPRAQGMRRAGSAAMDLAYVAAGRLDGFWELKLNPWDMAAGMLLVEEAGGRVSDRSGQSTDMYTDIIVATNGHIHDLLVGLLSSVPSREDVDGGA